MAAFFGCGFARVAAKLSYLKANGKVEYNQEQRWKKYLAIFQGEHKTRYEVDKYVYTKRSKGLVDHFKRWKTAKREQYIEHFSPTNWEKLTEHEKRQHCRSNCKACDVHHFSHQSLFPLWGNKTKSVTDEGVYKKINSRVLKLSSAGNVKVTKKALKAATKEVYDRINVPFAKTFGVTFAVAQTSVTELNVQVKKSRAELRREKRDKSRADKIHIQEQGHRRPATLCLVPGRHIANGASSGCPFPLKLQRRHKTGPIKEHFWKNKASVRRKGTLRGHRILTLIRMGSCKK